LALVVSPSRESDTSVKIFLLNTLSISKPGGLKATLNDFHSLRLLSGIVNDSSPDGSSKLHQSLLMVSLSFFIVIDSLSIKKPRKIVVSVEVINTSTV
jgi:hypothetical protein